MEFSSNKKRRAFYRRILQWAIVVAIFAFLAKMVCQNWVQVREASFAFRPFPLVLSTLIFASSYFIQIWAWYLITLRLGISLSPLETLENWFFSQLGKYLPGKLWLLLGRFYLYESRGKSKKIITMALYFETATNVVAAGLIFLASLLLFEETQSSHFQDHLGWLVPIVLLSILVFLHPRILERALNGILHRFKREPLSLSLSYLEMLWILFLYVLTWAIGGIGFSFFVDSVYPVAPKYFLFLTGAMACSTTVGLLALFAPSGLGVREGALVYLLSFIMPGPVAVILSVLTRIWMTFIEMGLIGVVYLSHLYRKRLRTYEDGT